MKNLIQTIFWGLLLASFEPCLALQKRPLIGPSNDPQFQQMKNSQPEFLPLNQWYQQYLQTTPSESGNLEEICETKKNSCELEIKKWLGSPLKSDQIYFLKQLYKRAPDQADLKRLTEGESILDFVPKLRSDDSKVLSQLLKTKYPQVQTILVNGRNLNSLQIPLLSSDAYFQIVLLSDSHWPMTYWGTLTQLKSENLMFQSLMGQCESTSLVTHPPELDSGQWICPESTHLFNPKVTAKFPEHSQRTRYWIPATVLGLIGASYLLKNKEIEIHGF